MSWSCSKCGSMKPRAASGTSKDNRMGALCGKCYLEAKKIERKTKKEYLRKKFSNEW